MPLIATDSNPFVSIPLKLLSRLLPYSFQFQGWWVLISIFLSYSLAFGLLRYLSGRRVGSVLGAAFVSIAPILPFRWNHNSLASQWLILGAFSVFLRPRSDRSTVSKYAGLHALAIAIHRYFAPMIAPRRDGPRAQVRPTPARARGMAPFARSARPWLSGHSALWPDRGLGDWVADPHRCGRCRRDFHDGSPSPGSIHWARRHSCRRGRPAGDNMKATFRPRRVGP